MQEELKTLIACALEIDTESAENSMVPSKRDAFRCKLYTTRY